MKFLYVSDPSIAVKLIEAEHRVLQQIFDIEQNPLWIFEYDPQRPLCFDINDTSFRRACFVSDHLTMRF